jgi:hypothetical protein
MMGEEAEEAGLQTDYDVAASHDRRRRHHHHRYLASYRIHE